MNDASRTQMFRINPINGPSRVSQAPGNGSQKPVTGDRQHESDRTAEGGMILTVQPHYNLHVYRLHSSPHKIRDMDQLLAQ